MEEGGDDDTMRMRYDEGEDLVTVTVAEPVHLVTDAVIVDNDVVVEVGGGRVHEHDEDEHWSL